MDLINKGEFFPINTSNRKEAFQLVADKLKTGEKDKGYLVATLNQEEIYKQKQDCRDFIKNVCRCRNIGVESVSQRKIAFPEKTRKQVVSE